MVLTDNQQVDLTIEARTAKGNVAKLDGVPVWEVSDAAIVAITPAADGLSCNVKAVGPVGTAQVVVRADADLDVGEVREVIGTLDIEVVAGEAVVIGVVAGAPTEQV